jgi:1-aminocyclopropane-1-carboxylate deaminase
MVVLPQHIDFNYLSSTVIAENKVELIICRLDLLHPEVSGNKLFKLYYYVDKCLKSDHRTILTFGGAYSNHLVATAFLCKESGLKSIGIVRGERPEKLSHTLLNCESYGMKLVFISRATYSNADDINFTDELHNIYGDFILVPEGGYGKQGAHGAALIHNYLTELHPTHICTAVGTATTLAGLMLNKKPVQNIIGVPVIKNMKDIPQRLSEIIGTYQNHDLEIFEEYHFGGYAKYNTELIGFMNNFYQRYKIPTDFIYTAKMMFAIMDKIAKDHFRPGSKIICLHTGGLQGNFSLPKALLNF